MHITVQCILLLHVTYRQPGWFAMFSVSDFYGLKEGTDRNCPSDMQLLAHTHTKHEYNPTNMENLHCYMHINAPSYQNRRYSFGV